METEDSELKESLTTDLNFCTLALSLLETSRQYDDPEDKNFQTFRNSKQILKSDYVPAGDDALGSLFRKHVEMIGFHLVYSEKSINESGIRKRCTLPGFLSQVGREPDSLDCNKCQLYSRKKNPPNLKVRTNKTGNIIRVVLVSHLWLEIEDEIRKS